MMNIQLSTHLRGRLLIALVAALVFASVLMTTSVLAAPLNDTPVPDLPAISTFDWAASSATEATLPATTCSLWMGFRACALYALPTTLTMPDSSTVQAWGFAPSTTTLPTVPGPAIIVEEGESVLIVLSNQIPGENVSLMFPGFDLAPDTDGVPFGSTASYVFTASKPGTYLYEAGLTANGPRQVAMGLFGALIVRPAGNPTWAFNDASTAFNDESLLIFSEIDPAFNADPINFDLLQFKPKFWLLNGQAYSQIPPISTLRGNQVLLRYLNSGLQEHSISSLGLHQSILGADGGKFDFAYDVVSESMGPGQSLDAMLSIPVSATVGTRYMLFNSGLQQNHNNGALAGNGTVTFGGMLTYLEVTDGVAVADSGPLATSVTLSAYEVAPTTDVTLFATLDDSTTGGSNVTAAEWFTDSVGVPGSGFAFSVTPGVTVNVSALIPASTLAGWEPGDITFYVRGQDANGNWGPVSSTVLDLVTIGPVIRGMGLSPNPTNGSLPVAIQATADDTTTGNRIVAQAEYFIDAPGANGTGTVMSLNLNAPLTSVNAVIPQVTVDALAEGEHVIYIHAKDDLENWGAFGTISLYIDKTGPPTVGQSLAPNPNNGTLPIHSASNAVRLMVQAGSLLEVSNIERVEGFIDTTDIDGTGFPFVSYDALYDSRVEMAYVDIPLPSVNLLSEGPHPIFFHAKDVAGNWGAFSDLTLVVDKTGPDASGVSASPNPTAGSNTVLLTATVTDPSMSNGFGTEPGSTIMAAEWFEGPDPGLGQGTALAAQDTSFDSNSEAVEGYLTNIGGWTNGDHTVSVRGKDAAGNWGPASTYIVSVTGNPLATILVDGFEQGNLDNWGLAVGNVAVGARLDGGLVGLQAKLDGGKSSYLIDRTPSGEASYRASFLMDASQVSSGARFDILVGKDANGIDIFGVEIETSAAGAEVRAWALQAGERQYSQWHHTGAGAQTVQLRWLSASKGLLELSINGKTAAFMQNLDTSASRLENVLLGASSYLSPTLSGSMYFDAFASYRDALMPGGPFKLFLPTINK